MLTFRNRQMYRQESARSIMSAIIWHCMHGHNHIKNSSNVSSRIRPGVSRVQFFATACMVRSTLRTRQIYRQESARIITRGILCHCLHGHWTGYYHWREPPHDPILSRQNTSFVANNNICHDKYNFVATSLHVFCRDKILVLSWQEYFSRD